jgi:hypothetical protein
VPQKKKKKSGSDEDWVCQLLIKHVNDKSSDTQKEMEYALCWRQSPVVLFPPRGEKKTQNPFLTGIYSSPFPSPFACSSLWLRHQSWPQPCPPGFHPSTSTPFNSQSLRLLLKITKTRKLEK